MKKNQWRTFPAIVDRLRYGVYCRLNRIIKAFITCIKLSGEFILRLSKSLASGIAMPGGVSGNFDSITFHDDPKVWRTADLYKTNIIYRLDEKSLSVDNPYKIETAHLNHHPDSL